MKKQILSLFACCFMASGFANNIAVSNTSLSNQDATANTVTVNFDVSWENSWRTSTNESNYDGAWIFVKFRKNGTSVWNHARVTVQSVNAAAASTNTTDNMGVFIYRNSNYIGNVNYTNNKLTWDYGADGVLDNDNVEIKVFALEMVYIPTGDYYLGSGGGENNCFKQGATTSPYLVSSAGAIPTGTSGNVLNFNGKGSATGNQIPATFPNGYNAFWIMKYECTQQQYTDFLNCLTQQEANVLVAGNTGNGSIYGTTVWPGFIPAAPEQAYNNVNSTKFLAIADWSGLRPMSEMEFEKACRGAYIDAVAGEYAWGNTNLNGLAQLNLIENPEAANESIISTEANANIGGNVNRPVRVGIFARLSGSSRILSGATYYGVMNMSDNVCEFTIYSGNQAGQSISASTHGNGLLNPNGTGVTDVPIWSVGALGWRGSWYNGHINVQHYRARVSDRANVDNGWANNANDFGIRLVRTAP